MAPPTGKRRGNVDIEIQFVSESVCIQTRVLARTFSFPLSLIYVTLPVVIFETVIAIT